MADSFVDAVNSKALGGNAIVPEALDLVKTFESFKPTSYYDIDNKKKRGTLTVGYGFTKHDIPDLREGYVMDKARAEQMLPDLLTNKYADAIRSNVKVPLNDNQFSALTSFAYNVGPTNFANSTLLKKLNSGDFAGAASEFAKWNKSKGQIVEGLTRRRAAEQALFNGDTQTLGKILEGQKFKLSASTKTAMFQEPHPVPYPMPEPPEDTTEETAQVAQPVAQNFLFT